MDATLPRIEALWPPEEEKTTPLPDPAPIPAGGAAPGRWGVVRFPLAVFALTRALYIAITYGAISLFHSQDRLAGVTPGQMLSSWQHWDVLWFETVAAGDYAHMKDAAFFPLMPLLMKIVALPLLPVMGSAAYYLAGVIVANTAFAGALILLHMLVTREYDAATAGRAVLYLALYPKALFTFTAYSESLFLLLAIGCVLLLRRGHVGWAGLLAALTTLDRLAGLALLVPLGMTLYARHRGQIAGWLRGGWVLLLPSLALGGYMTLLAARLGDPLAFAHAEATWGRASLFPLLTLILAATSFVALPFGSSHSFNRIIDLSVALAWLGVLGAALSRWGRRRLPIAPPLLGLALALTLLPLSDPLSHYMPDLISSLSRYLLVAFPVFILLARLTARHPHWHEALLIGFTTLSTIFTAAFVLGYYVV